jgi:MFS family permease
VLLNKSDLIKNVAITELRIRKYVGNQQLSSHTIEAIKSAFTPKNMTMSKIAVSPNSANRSSSTKSRKNDQMDTKDKLKLLWSNKAYRLLVAAGFFRFMGGYSIGYWNKNYFQNVYPEYELQFVLIFNVILFAGGVPSELIGGYLCDMYESSYPSFKGKLSAAGAFLGAIFATFTFAVKTNFHVQVVCFYFEYLFAEVFFGPSYAQINKMIPSTAQGLAVTIFCVTGAISGSVSTYVLGVLGQKFKTENEDMDPQIYGTLLGGAILISYLGCIPFFLANSGRYE